MLEREDRKLKIENSSTLTSSVQLQVLASKFNSLSSSLLLGGEHFMAAEGKGTGLPKNTAAALSYVLGPITGVLFYVLEKDPYVRFHAMQSIVVFVLLFVLQWVFGLTLILLPLVPLLSVLGFVLWLVLIYKAWQGDEWEVPVVGKYARKMMKKA